MLSLFPSLLSRLPRHSSIIFSGGGLKITLVSLSLSPYLIPHSPSLILTPYVTLQARARRERDRFCYRPRPHRPTDDALHTLLPPAGRGRGK